MLKISVVESAGQRTLVVEGKLVAPWTTELVKAWRTSKEELQGRKLVVDLTNVTLIGGDAKDILLELMRDGANFSGRDVLTRHVLRQLTRRWRLTSCTGAAGEGDD